VVNAQPSVVMPPGKAVPLTFRAIRLILRRNAESFTSGPSLPPNVVAAQLNQLRSWWGCPSERLRPAAL